MEQNFTKTIRDWKELYHSNLLQQIVFWVEDGFCFLVIKLACLDLGERNNKIMGALGYDFSIFFNAARSFLAGNSPYITSGFFSPYPFVFMISIFAILPYNLAYFFWTILNFGAVAYLSQWKMIRAIIFLPVFFAIWVGQIDIILIALAFTRTWIGVALLSLKPQLAIWLLPYFLLSWYRNGEKQKIIKMSFTVGLLYLLPTVIDPTWWIDWFVASPSALKYAENASSLFGISAMLPEYIPSVLVFSIIVIICGLTFYFLKPRNEREFLSLVVIFNPIANIYSHSLLIQHIDWIAVVLSWLLLPLSLKFHTGLPWVIIPIYIVLRNNKKS